MGREEQGQYCGEPTLKQLPWRLGNEKQMRQASVSSSSLHVTVHVFS
jgi:hypothetical protein